METRIVESFKLLIRRAASLEYYHYADYNDDDRGSRFLKNRVIDCNVVLQLVDGDCETERFETKPHFMRDFYSIDIFIVIQMDLNEDGAAFWMFSGHVPTN